MFLSTLNPSSCKECRQAVTSAAVDLSLSTDEAVRQTCSDPYTVYSPGRLPDYHRPTGQYLLWIHSRGCKLMLKYLSYSTVTLQHGKMNYCCNSNTSHWRLPSHTCWTFGAVDSENMFTAPENVLYVSSYSCLFNHLQLWKGWWCLAVIGLYILRIQVLHFFIYK